MFDEWAQALRRRVGRARLRGGRRATLTKRSVEATITVALLAAPLAPLSSQPTGTRTTRAATSPASIRGEWRFVRAVVAPWVKVGEVADQDPEGWIGRTLRFEANRVVGPAALSCAEATYTPTRFQADALFQGSLPEPARDAAAALGLVEMPVSGTSLDCDAGLFEFHRADANTMLMALNNVIWTLDRSPGSFAPDTAPAGVVQRLLERHFAADMGFDSVSVVAKARWLSDGLRARIARYFARPTSPNEAPTINGDPFTDSQEYPTRFSVARGTVTGGRATVTARFSDGRRVRPVSYLLVRQRDAWVVDDLRYGNRETLSQWLR